MSFWGGVVGKTIFSTRLCDVRIVLVRDEIVLASGFQLESQSIVEPTIVVRGIKCEPAFVPNATPQLCPLTRCCHPLVFITLAT